MNASHVTVLRVVSDSLPSLKDVTMKLKNVFLGLAAASVALSPVAASAVAAPRVSAPIEGENEFGGEQGTLIGILAALAAIVVVVVVADGDDDPISA